MKLLKVVTFIVLLPLMGSLLLFIHFTVGGNSQNDWKWYQNVWDSKKYFQILLAVLVTPLYWVVGFIMNNFFEPWGKLIE